MSISDFIERFLMNKQYRREDNNVNNMLKQNILVSVIIPIYNVMKYLRCSIGNVINQTYINLDFFN